MRKNRSEEYKKRKRSPAYHSWNAMIQRCTNPKHRSYEHYGARGVTVDPSWIGNFKQFLADMGERPEGMTLDRIDYDKPYCKENCKWATDSQQSKNRRHFKPGRNGIKAADVKDNELYTEYGVNI